MRHFVLALSVAALPLCMSMGTTERALIAGAGAAQALTAGQPRAIPGAVDIAVVTPRADLYLYPAAATLVEPVRRLLE
jgi:hypothetical protein